MAGSTSAGCSSPSEPARPAATRPFGGGGRSSCGACDVEWRNVNSTVSPLPHSSLIAARGGDGGAEDGQLRGACGLPIGASRTRRLAGRIGGRPRMRAGRGFRPRRSKPKGTTDEISIKRRGCAQPGPGARRWREHSCPDGQRPRRGQRGHGHGHADQASGRASSTRTSRSITISPPIRRRPTRRASRPSRRPPARRRSTISPKPIC